MKAAHPEVVTGNGMNPGETLRQARERQNWSLPDVALRLNLTANSLNHLENGAFDKLPGHTFARGYVRAYAKLLELDQTELVAQFDQYTGSNAKGSEVHALGRIEEPVRLSHNILRIVSLLLLLVLVGGGFLWWQDQGSLRGKDVAGLNLEHVEVESADGTTQIHQLDEPAPAPQVTEGTTSSLPLTPSTPSADNAPAVPESTTSAAPAASTPPVASAPVAAAPSIPAAVTSEPIAPIMPGSGQVSVKFVANCWAQVTDANGKVLASGLKLKGQTLDVTGKPPLSLRLGYARGAEVSYNGQPVDVAPFITGETARLKLGQ